MRTFHLTRGRTLKTLCGGRNPFLRTMDVGTHLHPHLVIASDVEFCPLCVNQVTDLDHLAAVDL